MKIIKLKNCLLFMAAINSIGSKWGIKEYKKLLEGEDSIKKLTLILLGKMLKEIVYPTAPCNLCMRKVLLKEPCKSVVSLK